METECKGGSAGMRDSREHDGSAAAVKRDKSEYAPRQCPAEEECWR
jgi:hypothetical protein